MTIEERLERLTERHEALTQSIELMHRDFESRFGQIAQTFETCLDSIKRLERIAVAHEDRLEGLEGQ
jgi:hypothetical protein